MTNIDLMEIAEQENIEIIDYNFTGNLQGFYADCTVFIKPNLTVCEQNCVLAEELGHYFTSHGDILDQSLTSSKKQELRAHHWAHEKLLPLEVIISTAYINACRNRYELAQELDVTENFLQEALDYYARKYEIVAEIGDYAMLFDPLTICKYSYD